MQRERYDDLSKIILDACIEVHRHMGPVDRQKIRLPDELQRTVNETRLQKVRE